MSEGKLKRLGIEKTLVLPPRTGVHFGEGELSGKQAKTTVILAHSLNQASTILSQEFMRQFTEYQYNKRGNPNSKIPSFMEGNNLQYPELNLYAGDSALDFLASTKYSEEQLEEDSLLLVFNLPKPLAVYWWKTRGILTPTSRLSEMKQAATELIQDGSEDEMVGNYKNLLELSEGAPEGSNPIEWGRFTLGMARYFTALSQESHQLNFRRINERGIHDPRKYYYMWEVGLPHHKR